MPDEKLIYRLHKAVVCFFKLQRKYNFRNDHFAIYLYDRSTYFKNFLFLFRYGKANKYERSNLTKE